MRSNRRRLNRKSLLTALIIVSVAGFLLPQRITGSLISLVQVIVPFQDWASRGVDAAAEVVDGGQKVTLSRNAYETLLRENQALRHQLASADTRYTELEIEHEALAGIRKRGLAGGRLISARTVAADALSHRESRLINAGTLKGVKHAAPVASDYFTINLDDPTAARNGLAVLTGEVLVGFIEQVGTHSARVRLLTDRHTKMSPIIARWENGVFYPLDKEFWLVGTGGPLLEIRDVDHRYIKTDAIKVGDVVLTSSYDTRLPASMTIGTIKKIHNDPDNTLLYILDVEPPLAANQIRNVFVVDPEGAAPPGLVR